MRSTGLLSHGTVEDIHVTLNVVFVQNVIEQWRPGVTHHRHEAKALDRIEV